MKISAEKITVLVGRVIDALGALIFLKMLSTVASKADVGQYMLASSLLTLVLTVSYSALDQGLLRNVTDYRAQASLGARYSGLVVMYFSSSFVIASVLVTMLSMFGVAQGLHGVLGPLATWLAFETVKNLSLAVASGLRSRQLIVAASTVDYACRLALLWLAHSHGIVSTRDVLLLLAAASLAASLVYLWGHRGLLSRFSWPQVRASLADAIRFSWPMIIWGLFGWLQNMANRWLLGRFTDLDVVAEYGVLVSISSFPVTAMLGVVVTYVVPILYERESAVAGTSRPLVRRVALYLVPIGALMVVLVAIWHRELVVLLSREGFAGHSHFLPIVMAANCISAICSILTYAEFAQRRVSSLLIPNTLPGAFSLAFGILAVSRHQFEGAIWTLVLSQLLTGTLFVVGYVRSTKENTT